MSRDTLSRAPLAALTGVLTTAYYATPDVIPSRPVRAVVKGAIVAVLGTAAVRQDRHDQKLAGVESGPEAMRSALEEVPPAGRWALGGLAAIVAAGSIALTVAGERWIFRRGEARAAAGARLAHAAPALLWGAVAAGLTLVPLPDTSGSAGTSENLGSSEDLGSTENPGTTENPDPVGTPEPRP